MRGSSVMLGLAALLLASAPALAQGDAEWGRTIARYWCSQCHLIAGQGSAIDGAPPFAAVAADPAKTPLHLRNWLLNPHYPMPKIELTRQEIDDLVAYIESLRAP